MKDERINQAQTGVEFYFISCGRIQKGRNKQTTQDSK
jgi:hypothetical protein